MITVETDSTARLYIDGSFESVRNANFQSSHITIEGLSEVQIQDVRVNGNGYVYGLSIDDQGIIESTQLGERLVELTGWGFPSDPSIISTIPQGMEYDVISSSYDSIVVKTHAVSNSEMNRDYPIDLSWGGTTWVGEVMPSVTVMPTTDASCEISSISADYETGVLTISGRLYQPDKFTSVTVGELSCTITSVNENEMACELPRNLHGRFTVRVEHENGNKLFSIFFH